MKKNFTILALSMVLAIFSPILSGAQQPAFPGAEGAGKFTSGGRGTNVNPTTVFEVTNLTDDNTPGSLRYACSQSTSTYPYRTIVFRVSGTIHLNSRLNIPRNTTVAGQTAPGDGICIADHPVVINGDNVIVRYLRIRMGDKNQLKTTPANCGLPVSPFSPACMPTTSSGGDDAFGNLGGKNIIIDHCSISWSSDEALTIYRGDSITVQWNFIEEPLNYSYHFEGDADFQDHGYGGIWGAKHGTFHHNLVAHAKSRMPRLAGNSTYGGAVESADLRNNVLYNWGLFNIYGGEGGEYNLVNNYYKFGPNTPTSSKYRIVNVDKNDADGLAKYYLAGNYVDGSPENTADNWKGAYGTPENLAASKQNTPYLSSYPQVTPQTATEAFESVLQNAGASLPRRDTMDRRIVNDVRYRTGRIIDVQGGFPHGTPYAQTMNSWPSLNSKPAPVDTDHDGMPDTWETANGLNVNNAADRQTLAANGYTNLENYLNSITNTSPEIEVSGVLNPFTQSGNPPSAVQTVILSGYNLAGNVTITPPVGFEVSTDGSNWYATGSPLVLNPGGTSLANTNLSIRLNSSTVGPQEGFITVNTPNADPFYIKVKGNKTEPVDQEAALATWPLLSNPDPVITGAITATGQVLGAGLSGIQYGSSFGGINGWQRVGTAGLPIGYTPTAYVEYTVTPAPGKVFVDTAISLYALGGGTGSARMAIFYSKDGFSTSQAVGPIVYNGISYANALDNTGSVSLLNTSTAGLAGQQVARASTNISVAPGETLTIRLFVWITGTGTRYFPSQQVIAMGYTQDASTLPLRLLQFSAGLHHQKAQLQWKTADEINTKGFDIESSEDGRIFKQIGFIAAKGKMAGNQYQFIDLQDLSSKRYYRLKMLDRDGKFSYSKVLMVSPEEQAKLKVYPNPAVQSIWIKHPLTENGMVMITSTDGKVLRTYRLQRNVTTSQISIGQLPAGNYMVVYEGYGMKEAVQITKQ